MSVAELMKMIENLPPELQEEVADFVEFLSVKKTIPSRRGHSVRGKYAAVPTSSDAFAARKAEEIEREG